jgi:uncharacterized protein (TIGR03067 family)
MRRKVLLVLGAWVLLGAEPARDDVKKELKKLQGEWVMAELEIDGRPVPGEKFKGTTLVIRGDKYTVKVKGRSYETTFTLDPGRKPKALDMFFPDGPNAPKVSKGIYSLEGDTFKLCRAQAPGQPRPKEFATWPDTGVFLVTWKRPEK